MQRTTQIVGTTVIWFISAFTPLSWADDRIPTVPVEDRKGISESQAAPGHTSTRPTDVASPESDVPPPPKVPDQEVEDDPAPHPPGKSPATDANAPGASLQDVEDATSNDSEEKTAKEPQMEVPPQLLEEARDDMRVAILTLAPEFVRPLTPIRAGQNDSNPVWSPSGHMLAFERSIGDQRKIVIALRDGTIIKTIYFQTPEEEGALDLFLPGITDTASYNSGMSWSGDNRSLVFMSNGGSGNYDLYLLSDLNQTEPLRLTHHHGKESHPHWSPNGHRLVFVSGSTGKADIFTMELASRKSRQISRGKKMYLYPQWSPDGHKIAMIYGSNENHDVLVIDNLAAPLKSTRALTTWAFDDLRPVWSPDGSKIAFYSNYNAQGDPKLWCIIVVAADGSDIISEYGLSANVVAHQVIPDIDQGPAWMPDSRHIVYVKNDEQEFNPIYLVDIEEKTPIAVQTNTKMNHDVTCAADGTLAFRAQVEQWDHIYIGKIDPDMAAIEEIK